MAKSTTKGEAKKKAQKPRGLTTKQIKFVKAKASGMPGYKAAMAAYDTTNMNVANQIAVENLQKPTVRQAVDAEMERQGITLEAAIRPIKEALSDDELSYRMQGSDRALKLMGAFQNQNTPNGPTINFNF